jgi:hypothetical protein
MTIRNDDLILLDTNTLIHWARQDSTGKYLLEQYALDQRTERPLLSTVVEGEIRGLAKCWKWGTKRMESLDRILLELVRIDAGHPDIVKNYADLLL